MRSFAPLRNEGRTLMTSPAGGGRPKKSRAPSAKNQAPVPTGPVPANSELLAAASALPFFEAVAELLDGPETAAWGVEKAGAGFAAALLLRARRQPTRSCLFVCKSLREQEEFYNDLLVWEPNALFLPRAELASVKNAIPDPEVTAERLGVLRQLAGGFSGALVLSEESFGEPLPEPSALNAGSMEFKEGERRAPSEICSRLMDAGFVRGEIVAARGEFALRGGILDFHPPDRALPVRLEFFDDDIESIREFDPDSQRTIRRLGRVSFLLGDQNEASGSLQDYFSGGFYAVSIGGAGEAAANANFVFDNAREPHDRLPLFLPASSGGFLPGELAQSEGARKALHQSLRDWKGRGWRIAVFCANSGELERLRELLGADAQDLDFLEGSLGRGFILPAAGLVVLSDAELLGRYQTPRARRLGSVVNRHFGGAVDVGTLEPGDLVVHLEHGIGRFQGMRADEAGRQQMVIEYAEQAKLYLPLELAHLVGRYVGIGKRLPPLSSLGDQRWAKARAGVERSVESFAARLLAVQASRETREGHQFSGDKPWQTEFEGAFPYRETPDQLRAIAATKQDMESSRPMDRLICGDVGFGKTEVAIRAAFKAVMDGKQVALLVPTTVLAAQHHRNFRERMSDYPIRVELLSRFQKPAEQKSILAGLADGSVDIVVGTHRLISADVRFRDLGLVVIDEEQRFGVRHKEKLKARFELVDQLTLSATPIPRTLYLSLLGAKDMSTIETAPPNRYPVETVICPYDERIIRDALSREISRGGQIYFLHNRVATIQKTASRLAELVPSARILVGHGQMEEGELEVVMRTFVAGEADVLVATTIIESGLDIPNANTIIIDRADRFGLADLYQLRGRVGRAQHKAYAYLMLPRDMVLAGAARKRVNAIEQYSTLGAGFRVAMRDLEIRGAGNILGTEQSGHVLTVGFDLYCRLLRDAISRARGEPTRKISDIILRIDFLRTNEGEALAVPAAEIEHIFPAYIPSAHISEPKARMAAYRALAAVTTERELANLREEWLDRYGSLPVESANLIATAELRLAAVGKGVDIVEVRGEKVILSRNGDVVQIANRFPRLTSSNAALRFAELTTLVRNL